jgi:DNA-binding transcriptional LysR family regulator
MLRLDPTSLNLFVRVVEEGTITAAADREHIAAAAVSKRLSELESVLHTPLLMRTNKGVEATAAGFALLAMARRVLHELDQIPVQMLSYTSGVRGIVRVCASMSAITQFLPADIQSFLNEYPDVQVQLEEKASSAVTKAVADNAADIGIYTATPHGQQLETLSYHMDRLVLCVPRSHPLSRQSEISFTEALDENLVSMATGSAINLQLVRAASEAGRPLHIRIQVTSFDALCMMISSGLGVGVMPEAVARRNAATLGIELVALTDAWARRQFNLCVRSSESLPVAASLLVKHLHQASRQNIQ